MLNYRLGTVNEKHWGLNLFSTAANLTLSEHFLEKIFRLNWVFLSFDCFLHMYLLYIINNNNYLLK